MNIILFEYREVGKPLPRRDERTVHLLKVLHKKQGDTFEAGVLGGYLGLGRIEQIKLDGSLCFSLDLQEEPPPRVPVRIAAGFSRPIQIKRFLRDLSNLGIEAVDLIGTDLGEKSYQDTKLLADGGARAALIEGAAQARDTRIPRLNTYSSLDDWLAERPWDIGSVQFFSEKADRAGPGLLSARHGPTLIAADNIRPEGSLALLSTPGRAMVICIGAERGWTNRERGLLEAAGFLRLSMGRRALRTETACVAAAVLAMEKIGRLD
ncbi:MAG: RsmE family RNA methyltransferase [Treponema sp.]|nr:RsmE family RNA methyltransferase [Treponema sp.]